MLTFHDLSPVTFISWQFHKRYLNQQSLNPFENYISKILLKFPRGQWVNLNRLLVCRGVESWIRERRDRYMEKTPSMVSPNCRQFVLYGCKLKCVVFVIITKLTLCHIIQWYFTLYIGRFCDGEAKYRHSTVSSLALCTVEIFWIIDVQGAVDANAYLVMIDRSTGEHCIYHFVFIKHFFVQTRIVIATERWK